MKKILCTITSLALFCSIFTFSACSDFAFNPLGEWECTSCLINDEETIDSLIKVYENILGSSSLRWVFKKDGTAYVAVGGEKMEERTTYTYKYDDNTVEIYVYDTFTDEIAKTQKYIVSENGQKISLTEIDFNENVIVTVYTRVS